MIHVIAIVTTKKGQRDSVLQAFEVNASWLTVSSTLLPIFLASLS